MAMTLVWPLFLSRTSKLEANHMRFFDKVASHFNQARHALNAIFCVSLDRK